MPPMKREPDGSPAHGGRALSVAQLARRWGVRQDEVRCQLAAEKLAFEQVCGEFRVALADILRYEQLHGPLQPQRLARKKGVAHRPR